MNKDNILFSIIGVLLGFIIGFVFANTANQGAAAPGALASQQQSNLPPDHPPVNGGQISAEDLAEAQEAAKVADENPDNFDAQAKAGALNYSAHRYEDAIRFLARANQLKPDDPAVIIGLGNANFDAGRYEEAEKWYTAALAKDPENVNVRTDMGLTFMFREPPNLDRAIAEFRKSLERDPKHPQTLQNLTVALTRKGDKKGAAETLAKLEGVSPGNAAIPRLRSDIAAVTGSSPAAPAPGKAKGQN